jgi:hypothetical protein
MVMRMARLDRLRCLSPASATEDCAGATGGRLDPDFFPDDCLERATAVTYAQARLPSD